VLGFFFSRIALAQGTERSAEAKSPLSTAKQASAIVAGPGASTPPETALTHLAERVRDSNASLNTLITLTSIVVGLIGLSLAAGIWQVKRYTAHVATTGLDARRDEYERRLEELAGSAAQSVESLHAAGIRNLTEAHAVLWQETAAALRELDRANCGVVSDETSGMLDERAKERDRRFHVALCAANLFSSDQEVVIDAAHELGCIADSSALQYLERTLDRLAGQPAARSEVQRALDQIRARDESGA